MFMQSEYFTKETVRAMQSLAAQPTVSQDILDIEVMQFNRNYPDVRAAVRAAQVIYLAGD